MALILPFNSWGIGGGRGKWGGRGQSIKPAGRGKKGGSIHDSFFLPNKRRRVKFHYDQLRGGNLNGRRGREGKKGIKEVDGDHSRRFLTGKGGKSEGETAEGEGKGERPCKNSLIQKKKKGPRKEVLISFSGKESKKLEK